jgi:hypothetical protein
MFNAVVSDWLSEAVTSAREQKGFRCETGRTFLCEQRQLDATSDLLGVAPNSFQLCLNLILLNAFIQDAPGEIMRWRSAIKEELEAIGNQRSIDDLEIASMLFFDITGEKTDQIPQGELTPVMTATPQQLIDKLKRYEDAGLTMTLL